MRRGVARNAGAHRTGGAGGGDRAGESRRQRCRGATGRRARLRGSVDPGPRVRARPVRRLRPKRRSRWAEGPTALGATLGRAAGRLGACGAARRPNAPGLPWPGEHLAPQGSQPWARLLHPVFGLMGRLGFGACARPAASIWRRALRPAGSINLGEPGSQRVLPRRRG
jgi:hypothetical protein